MSARPESDLTLDPDDWKEFRALARAAADDIVEHMRTIRQRPVWTRTPDDNVTRRADGPPATGRDLRLVYEEYQREIVPYALHNTHPRFWGWVKGSGAPAGVLGDMLAAGLNVNVVGANHAPVHLERKVTRWLATLMGFPDGADGLLVSGGSSANLHGLAVARTAGAGFDVRRFGVRAAPGALTAYTSAEAHSSMRKAMELLGLGAESLRVVPVDDRFHVDLGRLARAVAEDRAAGALPFSVIGHAGTVNTGAVDDLEALADFCARERLWFHVDGAFGAFARLGAASRGLVRGIERADSLAFDLHKWMYLPYECAAVLVRRGEHLRETFATPMPYLDPAGSELTEGAGDLGNMGIQLSRGFRALKVWMAIETYGTDLLGRMVDQNVAQARELAARVEAEPALELLAPVELNVACFGCSARDGDAAAADERTREVLRRLHDRGLAVPSHTRVRGRFAIRAAITNHRTRREDIAFLVDTAAAFARELEPVAAR